MPQKSCQTGLGSALPCAPRLPTFLPLPVMHVAEQGLVLGHGEDRTHRLTIDAVAVVHVAIA